MSGNQGTMQQALAQQALQAQQAAWAQQIAMAQQPVAGQSSSGPGMSPPQGHGMGHGGATPFGHVPGGSGGAPMQAGGPMASQQPGPPGSGGNQPSINPVTGMQQFNLQDAMMSGSQQPPPMQQPPQMGGQMPPQMQGGPSPGGAPQIPPQVLQMLMQRMQQGGGQPPMMPQGGPPPGGMPGGPFGMGALLVVSRCRKWRRAFLLRVRNSNRAALPP